MKRSCKVCWGLSALLVIAVAAMAYLFVIRGAVTASDDGRTTITLSTGERDFVLAEMRVFLEGVQEITKGLAAKDMKAVVTVAKKFRPGNDGGMPISLMGKLPSEFRALAQTTHKGFEALTTEAQDMGDQSVVLTKLSEVMLNCTACHATYRFEVDADKRK